MFFPTDKTLASELGEYIEINVNTQFGSLVKHLKTATRKYIKPLLGSTLYVELFEAYQGNTLSEDQALLLNEYVKPCLASYTKAVALPHLQMQTSDAGNTQSTSKDNEFQQVSESTFDLGLAVIYQQADEQADYLLEYLESEVVKFPTWLDSESFTIASTFFVPTTEVFTQYVPEVGGSRRVFLKLLPNIKRVERDFIAKILGKSLYDELRAKKTEGEDYSQLWERCAELCAYAVAEETLMKMSPILTQSAALSFPSYQGIRKKFELDANDQQVCAMRVFYEQLRDEKKADLTNYLEANAQKFPLYNSVRTTEFPNGGGDYSNLTSFDTMRQGNGGFVI